jgi:hypothetical protein
MLIKYLCIKRFSICSFNISFLIYFSMISFIKIHYVRVEVSEASFLKKDGIWLNNSFIICINYNMIKINQNFL